ncbi:MAG: hypothetical protein KL787_07345 [Taibaiella sp.]|nr:hypothetical protein [Taibaiella sp.]
MSSTEGTGTMREYAVQTRPTFFTCWLGSNDVLGYASDGGTGSAPGTGLSDITPLAAFEENYNLLIEGMTEDGAKGVLITIPDVTSVPAFNTIPYDGLVLTRESHGR